jgi:hypothetical protein
MANGKVINVSMAGTWVPNYASDPSNGWPVSVANFFYAQVKLPNGRMGLAVDGWSYAGWDNKVMYAVHMALLEQDAAGNMHVATSKYIGNDLTNGAGSVVVAGRQGILPLDPILPTADGAGQGQVLHPMR